MADPSEETTGGTLDERPEPDRLALEVARAKVAGALFADTRRVELGRYQLLEQVGSGGMGVVWGAWDPKLERRVAIKVLKAELARAPERVLEEGQALAKLSHPNVIPIYDVGVVDDQLYLVMEWVPGTNLRVHCATPRTVRELVALYGAAGHGLLAAHEAGLVHRDFKPENVMVGEDGRVRVLDFGIALAEGGTGRAGTPRYMPAEQASGGPVTAAADQYAFCVAMREALVERIADGKPAAVPPWLAAILDRGSAAKAADRYPGMAELLHALARDPRAVWRTRLAVGGAVAIAGAAFAIGSLRGGGQTEQCTGSAAELAGSWNDTVRDKLLAHLRTLGPYGAEEATRLDGELAGFGTKWIELHHGACTAHARGELTPQLYGRELACLANARAAFEIVIEVATRAPLDRFGDAIVAERGLPILDHCATSAVASRVEPPNPMIAPAVDRAGTQLARAHYLTLARDPAAVGVATAAAATADELGYLPLVARAQLERGYALSRDHAKLGASVTAYEQATAAALEGGDDVTFVEAYARELFTLPQADPSTLPTDLANTAASVKLAQRIARRTGTEGAFARALLYNNAGTERLANGDRAAARTWFTLAIAEQRAGASGIELATSFGNLALTTEDQSERDRLFREQLDLFERELGPHHASTLQARRDRAMFVADPRAAIPQLREACAALAAWRPEAHVLQQECNYELGWLLEEGGDAAGARAAMELARGEDETGELAALYLQLFAGDHARAASRAEAAAAKLAAAPVWWVRSYAIDAYLVAAISADALGDRVRATAALRAALVVTDDPGQGDPAVSDQRRRARVQAQLARELSASDPKAAAAVAAPALAWSRATGGYEARVAELAAITAAPGSR